MKAGIFNPYLDTLGGGERYTLSLARVLLENGFDVDIQWENPSIKIKLKERFGIDVSGIRFVKDIKRGDGYDVCFWVSDGSIPLLKARKNFLHFQVPFKDVGGKTLLNRMKLFRIDKVIVNSKFTKKFIDKEYGVDSVVVYPPVPVDKIKAKRKEKLIIYVGRFSSLAQSKRQDVLIKAFKKLYNIGFKDWRMILAGGVEVGVKDELRSLKTKSEGYPIEILESPSFETLKELYGKAKIFWSAAGFGIDEDKCPQKVEHFGITVVEAMAAGVVPIVYEAGGPKEVIKNGENGFLWRKESQLIRITSDLIKNPSTLFSISKKAREESGNYSYEKFKESFTKLL